MASDPRAEPSPAFALSRMATVAIRLYNQAVLIGREVWRGNTFIGALEIARSDPS